MRGENKNDQMLTMNPIEQKCEQRLFQQKIFWRISHYIILLYKSAKSSNVKPVISIIQHYSNTDFTNRETG